MKGEIEVLTVPGNHNSLVAMELHAGVFAERLREALERASRPERGGSS